MKAIVMDVDGTLTDGMIHIGGHGELFKSFSVKDGLAIAHMLPAYGIIPIIITGRQSHIVASRMSELGVSYIFQGISNKIEILHKVLNEQNIALEETAYIGDDLNDLDCMKICGISGCPQDAVAAVQKQADYVCKNAGGKGAVREFVEYITNKMEPIGDPGHGVFETGRF